MSVHCTYFHGFIQTVYLWLQQNTCLACQYFLQESPNVYPAEGDISLSHIFVSELVQYHAGTSLSHYLGPSSVHVCNFQRHGHTNNSSADRQQCLADTSISNLGCLVLAM